MSDGETKLGAAALAIALVALVTSVGQLLQQYFATADGYRRCHKSVMGEYARKTRLHWRWREFRFETLYTVPEIFMSGDGAPGRKGQVALTGGSESRYASLIPPVSTASVEMALQNEAIQALRAQETSRDEMAPWVFLLHWLHETAHVSMQHERRLQYPVTSIPPGYRLPAIVFRERSWDFQPPDVMRPLAKTTLSDIAVIARRMGMRWKDFRPSEGILRAEGHSHTITSTMVRSLGIVLQYSFTGQSQRLLVAEENIGGHYVSGSILPEKVEIYIPRAGADRLGCGVLRTERSLRLPSLTVSTQNEIITALSFLDRSGKSSAALASILKENPEFRFRVADLVALTTPPIRHRGSGLIQVPAPSDNVQGVTTSSIGRRAFRQYLDDYIHSHKSGVGQATRDALQICQDISTKSTYWDHTDEDDRSWAVLRDEEYLDMLQGHLHNLTAKLCQQELHYGFLYRDLLGTHIRVAMFRKDGETSAIRSFGTDYSADVAGYFRSLPTIIEEMGLTEADSQERIVDAWVTMMLRAMCWGACHFFVPGERIPIQYFGSQLPVYIG